MKLSLRIVSALLSLFALSCQGGADPVTPAPAPAPAPEPEPEASPSPTEPAVDATALLADRAFTYLEGQFDSVDQAERDAAFIGISLVTCAVDAPDLGTRVLYVEQSVIGKVPYRQRLYVVDPVDADRVRTRIFELERPSSARGLCSGARRSFTAADAIPREGCEVTLRKEGDKFVGRTESRCPSDHGGATHATTDVTLERTRLVSWDRGFDDEGAQVWGPTSGPYEFVRRTALRAETP